MLCGDTPLITGKTLTELVEKHRKEANGVTVLSAILDDATGYGRIIVMQQAISRRLSSTRMQPKRSGHARK